MRQQQGFPIEIGIVGGGPRGLFCLEQLALSIDNVPSNSRPSFNITLFEPSESPGAGVVYDTRQPDYLIMNFATRHINIWSDQSRAQYPGTRLGLRDWLARHHPSFSDLDGYVPRGLVGRYLADGYQQVLAALPDGVSVIHEREKVVDVQPLAGKWRVHSRTAQHLFDELILTVGHEGWRPAGNPNEGQVFPVDKNLSIEVVKPRSVVAIRGQGLTCIDAVLALTEGRGGIFTANPGGGLSYHSRGLEPSTIATFSRTGLPMLAKPDLRRLSLPSHWSEIWRFYRSKLEQLPRNYCFNRDIRSIVIESASRAAGASASSWLDRYLKNPCPTKTMTTSYRVAVGLADISPGMALAEAWRNLYPAIVRKLEHGGLGKEQVGDYHDFSSIMERIAFGPPAVNLAKMLALSDSGLLRIQDNTIDCDDTIDARIASPTAVSPASPLVKMLNRGTVRRIYQSEGIEIDRDSTALSNGGRRQIGLAIAGRVTEGCTIGNDTLCRKLNQHIDRWAARLASRYTLTPNTVQHEYNPT